MNQAPAPSVPTPTPPAIGSGVGGVVIIVLVAAVTGWLYMQRPQPVLGASPVSARDSAALRGFRSDLWFLPDDDLVGFVEIPEGPFPMGSDPGRDPLLFDNERWTPSGATGSVHLPQYFIGRYEVTVAQFTVFVESTGFRADDAALAGARAHPVVGVSWPDALAYCRWLEASLAESPATPNRLRELLENGWHIGLPSEAEWEKAARGTDGRLFPWGDEPRHDRANYESGGTTAVGSFSCPECANGLADASGNVWELTRSAYQPYPFDPDQEVDLVADALWVMRGGAFSDPARNIRVAIRGGADPGARRPFIGFRLALTRSGS